MPSPTSSSSTTTVTNSTSLNINALLGGEKWGGVTGTGTNLAFSFPWTTNTSAWFYGGGGRPYSTLNEPSATSHYGLNSTQQTAARGALQAWANVANVTFTEVAETSSNVGDIRFAWTSATSQTSTGRAAWGWAGYPNDYWPSGGDIWISTSSSTANSTSWAIGSYNFKSLIHELGHALGLKHPFEDSPVLPTSLDNRLNTVMSYTDPPKDLFLKVTAIGGGRYDFEYINVVPETPMIFDIAAIQYIYGANSTYRTGNDTYSFDPSTPFFKTIWDAGGLDTISVANFSKGCVVDLQPGHLSKITIETDQIPAGYSGGTTPTYDGTNNLGIALNCIIENAIGGSGNDTITGNDADNSLDGGNGSDVLYGDAGNDTFDWDSSVRSGNDTFYGGAGGDVYTLDSNGDTVVEYANEGTDTIWVSFSYSLATLPNVERLYGFGTNGLFLTGNSIANSLKGSPSSDTLNGDSGDDWLEGHAGNDILIGGDGVDGVSFGATTGPVTVNLLTGTSTGDGNDTISSIEKIDGSNYGDTLTGDAIQNWIWGNAGDDILDGGDGYDFLSGDAGNDTLLGGNGSDIANYYGISTSYLITSTATGFTISSATEGRDTLIGVELARFADKIVTLSSSQSDTTPPTVSTFSPADAATGVSLSSNIVLTFNESIARGTGSIILETAAGTTVEIFDAATSSRLTISGSTLTIDPTSDLSNSTNYYVTLASGDIKDVAGNAYAGTSTYDFTTVAAAISTPTTTLTKSKIFLSLDDNFTASSNGTTLYGNSGNDTVTIASGTTNVLLDQNVERVNFPGASSSYTFLQTGGLINVYDSAGTALLVTVPLQRDADGTVLSFGNGVASATLSSTGAMLLGGATISGTTASALAIVTTSGGATTPGLTKAKVFMGDNDSFSVSSSGMTLYGGSGSDTVTITSGTTNVVLDQNVERVKFSATATSYTFLQTGGLINVYDTAGTSLLTAVPLQRDADGTVLEFSNGSASATLQSDGVMKLGGATVSANSASAISPVLTTVSASVVLAGAASNVSLSIGSFADSGTTSSQPGIVTLQSSLNNTTMVGLETNSWGFDSDNIAFTGNATEPDANYLATGSASGQSVAISLVGIAPAPDTAIVNVASFNSTAGSGSLG